jgi:TPR repeat protein
MFSMGHGVKQDDAEAARWYRRGADAGEPRAMGSLGTLYAEGRGVSESLAEAESWLRKAAMAGDKRGMARLALVLLDTNPSAKAGVTPPNWNAMSASEQDAWRRAQQPAGQDEAVTWLEKGCDGAERYRVVSRYGYTEPGPWRDPLACYALGMLYATGSSGVRKDLEVADRCFAGTSMLNGDSYSMAWYELGNGTPRALRKAGYDRSVEFKTREARDPSSAGVSAWWLAAGVLAIAAIVGSLEDSNSGSSGSPSADATRRENDRRNREYQRSINCMAKGWEWGPPCLPPRKR